MPVSGGAADLVEFLRRLDSAGIPVRDVGLRRPTLDDVFLQLTGHAAEDGSQPEEQPQKRGRRGRKEKA